MKPTNLLFVLSVLILSCDNTATKTNRQQLIKEIENLRTTVGSNNKEQILQLFSFPIYDSAFGIYVDDSTYLIELDKNSGKLTTQMFAKYFPEIVMGLEFDRLNEAFKYFKFDSLALQDSLEFEIRNNNEPCYSFYSTYLHQDTLTLTFGTNSNEEYINESKKSDEDEGAEDGCEYASIWRLWFDGKKLHFISHAAAG